MKTNSILALSFASLGVAAAPGFAHEDHCAAIAASVEEAGFASRVTVTCTNDHATITSDTYPGHEMMTGIVGTNEQVPVPAEYAAPVILNPELGGTPLTRDAALGVAVNGVPIYDYTAGGENAARGPLPSSNTARHDPSGQLDICGGHAGRGDDYHYHAKPICMIASMANADDNPIIGWGFDGLPI